MGSLVALLAGLIFGCGLIAAGMNDPAKVLAFLDLAGAWDPSLALVMGGAIGVAVLPFARANRHPTSWLGVPMPPARHAGVDGPLLVGSAIFGIGWGLSGFCPGPGLLSLGAGYLPGYLFAITMLFGIEVYEWGVDSDRIPAPL